MALVRFSAHYIAAAFAITRSKMTSSDKQFHLVITVSHMNYNDTSKHFDLPDPINIDVGGCRVGIGYHR